MIVVKFHTHIHTYARVYHAMAYNFYIPILKSFLCMFKILTKGNFNFCYKFHKCTAYIIINKYLHLSIFEIQVHVLAHNPAMQNFKNVI